MRSSITPLMGTPFELGVASLDEARVCWSKGAPPGILSRAAMAFDEALKTGDVRGAVGGAVARGLAGDLEGARRRLRETIHTHPDYSAAYMALGVLCLRDPDPLAHAYEATWALIAARDLAPGVGCI